VIGTIIVIEMENETVILNMSVIVSAAMNVIMIMILIGTMIMIETETEIGTGIVNEILTVNETETVMVHMGTIEVQEAKMVGPKKELWMIVMIIVILKLELLKTTILTQRRGV
jgi:hypothetical protein